MTDARRKFVGVEYGGGNHGHHIAGMHLGHYGSAGFNADFAKTIFQGFHGGLLDFKIECEHHVASGLRGTGVLSA